ncbi:hypothetical protein SAMN02745753_03471 [Marinomonas polaris DSM 16579]|uniref:Uncharacterized protein n=1 Tax=Marinomonas polaris DSM 16579 TaxID=1122206 RepID=A0A1M5HWK8_9GAMM|nr:hypothetical protein [Marinomonas polaris]SHG20299.1 hypothetical protein SAMN02745753_03471 [Marinomonas polaris DSM 16579]
MYLQTTQTITLPSTIFISESAMASHYSLSDEYSEYDEYDEGDDEPYYGDPSDSDDDFWDDSNDD